MANIQPIVFPIIGTATKLEVLVLNFPTDAVTCTTYYKLTTDEGKVCTEGNYTLTDEEFEGWGEDNSYIDNLIATILGITII